MELNIDKKTKEFERVKRMEEAKIRASNFNLLIVVISMFLLISVYLMFKGDWFSVFLSIIACAIYIIAYIKNGNSLHYHWIMN